MQHNKLDSESFFPHAEINATVYARVGKLIYTVSHMKNL